MNKKIVISSLGRYHLNQVISELEKDEYFDVSYLSWDPKAKATVSKLYKSSIVASVFSRIITRKPFRSYNHLMWLPYDKWCEKKIKKIDFDIFHGFSSFSLGSLNVAKNKGAVTILERAGSHINSQEALVKEECQRLNIMVENGNYYQQKARMIEEYDSADYILTCSNIARNSFIENGISDNKIISIPLAANFQSEYRENPFSKKFIVLCVGGDFVRKGIDYLFQAFNKLDDKRFELWLFSSIPEDYKGKIPSNVILLPRMPHEKLLHYYRNASCLVLPSIEDGFGMVVLEAMSVGLPVIVSKSAGAAEVITENVNGFLYDFNDVKALHDIIQDLSSNINKLEELSYSCYGVADNYSWYNYALKLKEVYDRVLNK